MDHLAFKNSFQEFNGEGSSTKLISSLLTCSKSTRNYDYKYEAVFWLFMEFKRIDYRNSEFQIKHEVKCILPLNQTSYDAFVMTLKQDKDLQDIFIMNLWVYASFQKVYFAEDLKQMLLETNVLSKPESTLNKERRAVFKKPTRDVIMGLSREKDDLVKSLKSLSQIILCGALLPGHEDQLFTSAISFCRQNNLIQFVSVLQKTRDCSIYFEKNVVQPILNTLASNEEKLFAKFILSFCLGSSTINTELIQALSFQLDCPSFLLEAALKLRIQFQIKVKEVVVKHAVQLIALKVKSNLITLDEAEEIVSSYPVDFHIPLEIQNFEPEDNVEKLYSKLFKIKHPMLLEHSLCVQILEDALGTNNASLWRSLGFLRESKRSNIVEVDEELIEKLRFLSHVMIYKVSGSSLAIDDRLYLNVVLLYVSEMLNKGEVRAAIPFYNKLPPFGSLVLFSNYFQKNIRAKPNTKKLLLHTFSRVLSDELLMTLLLSQNLSCLYDMNIEKIQDIEKLKLSFSWMVLFFTNSLFKKLLVPYIYTLFCATMRKIFSYIQQYDTFFDSNIERILSSKQYDIIIFFMQTFEMLEEDLVLSNIESCADIYAEFIFWKDVSSSLRAFNQNTNLQFVKENLSSMIRFLYSLYQEEYEPMLLFLSDSNQQSETELKSEKSFVKAQVNYYFANIHKLSASNGLTNMTNFILRLMVVSWSVFFTSNVFFITHSEPSNEESEIHDFISTVVQNEKVQAMIGRKHVETIENKLGAIESRAR